ncbi:transposable element Tc1 transposase [Trichonephila clavipes]|nr:transposable element Tc1 transposase [Trichonephila clavipes]
MAGQRYIDEVLLPHARLFRGAVGDKFVFMDDNATCHRTLSVQDCLDREGVKRLVWPARSLDLNPIENVWDALGRQVAGRNYPPTNKNTLIRALTEEWDKLPQQLLDNVVQSMINRAPICRNMMAALTLDALPVNVAFQSALSNDIVSKHRELEFGGRFRIMDDPIFYEGNLNSNMYVREVQQPEVVPWL